MRRPDIKELLSQELQHPFHQNPDAWLDAHPTEIAGCFPDDGILTLRVPGSGLLRPKEEWIRSLAEYMMDIASRSGTTAKLLLESHPWCGAAKLHFGADVPSDEKACEAIKIMTKDLREIGVDASYEGDSAMNGTRRSPATLCVTIDCTKGRLRRPPVRSFVVNSPDGRGITDDALLALTISAGENSYGSLLVGTPFTFLIFADPDDIEGSERIMVEIGTRAEKFRSEGVDVRIVRRVAPPAATRAVPSHSILVKCIDERILP